MKLIEAMRAVHDIEIRTEPEKHFFLAVGFEPLHLSTFLRARLGQLNVSNSISLEVGQYGDLTANIRRSADSGASVVFVQIEWDDLDPRLGFRALGGWEASLQDDILDTARGTTSRLRQAIMETALSASVVVAGPRLPLAPVFVGNPAHLTSPAAHLHECIAAMFAALPASVKIVDTARLSPMPERGSDYKSLLTTGYPYSIKYSDILALALASAAIPAPAKKAIITDLDNTLWQGILGEDGTENIAWMQDDGALTHGLYQQLLNAFMEAGILVAIASKNEASLVAEAFDRGDLIFRHEEASPKEIHWEAKSQSVARILDAWNIGAESVVFIDDSASELGEVRSAFPDIDCRLFPTDDPNGVIELLYELRRDFARTEISAEDRIRARSINQAGQLPRGDNLDKETHETFLAELLSTMIIDWGKSSEQKRAFELLNKTNQMNLNGRRWDWSEWTSYLSRDDSFQMLVDYRDRFGPLGRIAVIGGRQLDDDCLIIDYWALSCRGFGRRIEYACLIAIFERFKCRQIEFDFAQTDRNQPMARLLAECRPDTSEASMAPLRREAFAAVCPPLYLETKDIASHV
jgi:FkbH-like protein